MARNLADIAIAISATVGIIAAVGWFAIPDNPVQTSVMKSSVAKSEVEVTYVVVSRSSYVSITYANEENGTSEGKGSSDRVWKHTVKLRPDQRAYVTAQSDTENGDVKVEVWVDGVEVKSSHSTGDYCIASSE